jgi:anti-anti-sigma regulatory factor
MSVRQRKQVDGAGLVVVPGKARLRDAIELQAQLSGLPNDAELTIDATAVEDVSTPYVLTLASVLRSREGQQPPAVVISPSSAFVDAFSDLGLFQHLMKMEFRS